VGYLYYGYNAYGLGSGKDGRTLGLGGHQRPDQADAPDAPVMESEVAAPSEMMAIGDGLVGWNERIRDGAHLFWRDSQAAEYNGSTSRAKSRHQGRANVVFCDGHVEAVVLRSLFEEASDATLRRWNRDNQPHSERLQP